MKESVSVIFPVYGRFNFQMKYAVESVLAQTHPVSEIILVDDGSPDETTQTLPKYIAETPSWRERVRYIYQENQGQAAATNAGIAKATGEWLAFNGSDDLWLPSKLEWQFRALEKYKEHCALCFTDAWFMNNPYEKTTVFQLAGNVAQGMLGMIRNPARLIPDHKFWMWAQTVLVRADLVRKLGGFDPYLRWSEDRDFLFRAALVTDFCYVGAPMVLIDRSPGPVKHVGEAKDWYKAEFTLRMDQYRVEKQLSLSSGLDPDTRRAIRKDLGSIHSSWTSLHLARGDFRQARSSSSTALRYYPGPRMGLKWLFAHLAPAVIGRIIAARRQGVRGRDDLDSWDAEGKGQPATGADIGRGSMYPVEAEQKPGAAAGPVLPESTAETSRK